jgi:WD40 repeat protein
MSPVWLIRPLAVGRSEGSLVAVGDQVPPRLLRVPGGDEADGSPTAAALAHVLSGGARPDLRFSDPSPAGETLRPGLPDRALRRRRPLATFRRSDPSTWPVTASAYGVVNGCAVRAVGSYEGAVWIWDLESRAVLAGPFADVPASVRSEYIRAKPGLSFVQSISLASAGGRTYVGTVCDDVARLWDVGSGQRVPLPDIGQSRAVALGDLDGRLLLARGSDTGSVRIFDVAAGAQIAGLTLDGRIEDVWLVPGERTVVVMTGSYELLLLNW